MAEKQLKPPLRALHDLTAPLLLVALVAGLGATAVLAVRKDDQKETATAAAPLVVPVRRANPEEAYRVRRRFVGRVEAARESAIGFELAGAVRSVQVDEGAAVAAGDPLARLDTARLEAQRREIEARVAQAKAERALAELRRDRVHEAFENDAASALEWDDARESYLARQASYDRAAAALDRVQVDLEKSVVYAPFDAVVIERHVDEGVVIQAGAPVVTLLERRGPEARIGLPGWAVQGLKGGDTVDVAVEGRPYAATVRAVVPRRRAQTRVLDALVTLEVAMGEVNAGDLVSFYREERIESSGFWLPSRAITEDVRGLWACFVVISAEEGQGRSVIERRPLELIHQREDAVYVRGGLEAGDRVAVEGIHRLIAGLRVQPQPAGGEGGGLAK